MLEETLRKKGDVLSSPEAKGTTAVAIPSYNEAKTIGSLVLASRRHADEVIVVDDGSVDDTAWIAEQAGARVLRHHTNRGYGAAIRTCLEYARYNGVETLVIMDGDGQHRPELIPEVMKPVAEGEADVSIGSRFLDRVTAQQVPPYRRFGIRLLTRLTNFGTRRNNGIKDGQSGFRAYSRAAIEALDPREVDMGASAETLWDADKMGLRIVEVPVEIDYDVEGSTKGPLRHGLSVIASMLRYIETEHALSFFGLPGLVLLILGLIIGYRVLTIYTVTAELAIGQALITVTLIILGVLLVFTGLILHAVIIANRRFR